MIIRTAWLWLIALLVASPTHAQDVTGNWQGTLGTGAGALRLLLQISEAERGALRATLISLDEAGFDQPVPANVVAIKDSVLTVKFPWTLATYEGRLSPDGKTLAGSWMQRRRVPLEFRRAPPETAWRDPSPHDTRLVTVDKDVRLEVLEWGGTGRPIVLLSGLGNTAHVFDQFAPKLAAHYRVYGVTRRGFGASSAPPSGYEVDRLADDVLAVLDTLGLSRPVLIGHSIAGQELSSIGSRFPNRTAGLVYLDAAFGYAFYDPARGFLGVEIVEASRALQELASARVLQQTPEGFQAIRARVAELIDSSLPQLERNLREYQRSLDGTSPPTTAPRRPPYEKAVEAIWAGVGKHTAVPGPVLAIYALPRRPSGAADSVTRAADAADSTRRAAQADAFQKGVPTARVVRLRHATHFVFMSNEADVLREIRAFVDGLHSTRP